MWVTDWPTEEGWYWFFGKQWSKATENTLDIIKVKYCGPPERRFITYTCNGGFVYKSDDMVGKWLALPTPLLPLEEEPNA
jgi:hypothetical protein